MGLLFGGLGYLLRVSSVDLCEGYFIEKSTSRVLFEIGKARGGAMAVLLDRE